MTTVLVVDDEPKMRELLVRYLAPAGYDVKEAGDAVAALEAARAGGIDVVVSDIHMPGQSGVWLVTELQREFPRIGIVLATAENCLPGSVTLRDGVVGYLLKPYSAAAVLKAVGQAAEWGAAAAQEGPRPDPVGEWLLE